MLFLSVLCLAVGALSHPTLFVPHATLESDLYYPSLAIVEADEKPVPGIPEAPKLEPIPLVKALTVEEVHEDDWKPEEVEVVEEKLEEEKLEEEKLEEEKLEEEKEENEEEIKVEVIETEKEGELEIEKHDEEEKLEEPKEPVVVHLEVPHIPESITNWWTNRPFTFPHISYPHINFPFSLSNIFSKPTSTSRYRISYDLPNYYIDTSRYRIIAKK